MIEVGEWIRTDTGLIRRIKSIDKEEATENCPVDMYWCNLDKPIEILKECSKDTIYAIEMSNAEKLKHSKNPIDLVEVGDYVNGYYCRYIIDINTGEEYLCNYDLNEMRWIPLENIDIWDNILTKELFEANCYKVKEEIC